MNRLYLYVVVLLFLNSQSYSQDANWGKIPNQLKIDFDSQYYTSTNTAIAKKSTNYRRITSFIDERNSFHFMHLGPVLNSLCIMYQNTGEEKYLRSADQIVSKVLSNAKKNQHGYFGWKAYSKAPGYKMVNGKEWKIFEAHFFRYVTSYLYMISQNKNSIMDSEIIRNQDKYVTFIENNVWAKWYIKGGKRIESFLGSRTHMGAQWAEIALYLSKLTNNKASKKIYLDYINLYDAKLRNNLKLFGGAYVWNSTWDGNSKEVVIQDVAHANHIVEYVISSYNLGGGWKEDQLKIFAKTFASIVYNPKSKTVFSNVDGSGGSKFINISDGWMKLAKFDKDLDRQIKEYIVSNYDSIQRGPFSLQYFAVGMNL